jgi:hypothetical protein
MPVNDSQQFYESIAFCNFNKSSLVISAPHKSPKHRHTISEWLIHGLWYFIEGIAIAVILYYLIKIIITFIFPTIV